MKKIIGLCLVAVLMFAGCRGASAQSEEPVQPSQSGTQAAAEPQSQSEPAFSDADYACLSGQAAHLTNHLVTFSLDYIDDEMSFNRSYFVYGAGLIYDPSFEYYYFPGYTLYQDVVHRGESTLEFPADAVDRMLFEIFGDDAWEPSGGDITLNEETNQYETNLEFGFGGNCTLHRIVATEVNEDSQQVATTFSLRVPADINGDPGWADAGYYTITYRCMRDGERVFLRYLDLTEAVRSVDDLQGQSLADFTSADFKLLLRTPVDELDAAFGIKPEDKMEWIRGITAATPMGVTLVYSRDSDAQYLSGLQIGSTNTENKDLPLGYTIDEVLEMGHWGETEVVEFYPAMGYNGEGATPLKELRYLRDGLEYAFQTDYNNVFVAQEEQDQSVALILIRLSQPQ